MQENDNAVKIAVLEEQIKGVREQQRAHNDSTQKRFDELNVKLDELTAIMNRGKGAYTASLVLAGAIGATILAVIGYAAEWLRK